MGCAFRNAIPTEFLETDCFSLLIWFNFYSSTVKRVPQNGWTRSRTYTHEIFQRVRIWLWLDFLKFLERSPEFGKVKRVRIGVIVFRISVLCDRLLLPLKVIQSYSIAMKRAKRCDVLFLRQQWNELSRRRTAVCELIQRVRTWFWFQKSKRIFLKTGKNETSPDFIRADV